MHESKAPQPRDRAAPLVYCRVAALNLATRSAGTRPRSFTSMPCALAHWRTSVLSARPPVPGDRPGLAATRRPRPAAPHAHGDSASRSAWACPAFRSISQVRHFLTASSSAQASRNLQERNYLDL